MKVVSIDVGRATWLFPTEEFAPLGGADGISVIQKVADRYQFKTFPENPNKEEVEKNGLKFSSGIIEFGNQRVAIGEFILYSDGIVAVSNETERSAAFLKDVTEYAIRELNFREPISPIKKIYASIVTVEFENSVANVLASQAALTTLIAGYLNAQQGTSCPVEVTRLDFSLNDPTAASNLRPKLLLESRLNIPLDRRRYHSNATMHTKEHLELLSKIEETFMNPSTSGA
jgi:hypothetical protein